MTLSTSKKTKKDPEKTLDSVALSMDGKHILVLFANGEGCRLSRHYIPVDDGSPITSMEIFDHGYAIVIHQSSGRSYDLPWDSIKHYAAGGREKKKNIGKKITALRKKLGVSQAQLAWSTRLSRMQISRIEKNRSEPSLDTLEKMAHSFNMTLGDLLAV